MKPLVQYFDPTSEAKVKAGEMVHEYYGVPVWLMKEYLVDLGAVEEEEDTMRWETGCQAVVRPAPTREIGSLTVGGSMVEFSGCEGPLEQMLEQLEWKTLRIGA